MGNGLGAAFFGLALFAVLLAIAALLVATTFVAVYRGPSPPLRYVAAGSTGAAVVVAGFGIAVLADEATPLAVLVAATVLLPLVLIAERAWWAGATWVTSVAAAGMAWSLPFLAAVGLLFVLRANTDVPTAVLTAMGGIVATGGALLVGEHVRRLLYTGDSSPDRT